MEHANFQPPHSPSNEEDVKMVRIPTSSVEEDGKIAVTVHFPSTEEEEEEVKIVKIEKIAETPAYYFDYFHENFLNRHHSFYDICKLCNKKIEAYICTYTNIIDIEGEVLEVRIPYINVEMTQHVRQFHPTDYVGFLNPPPYHGSTFISGFQSVPSAPSFTLPTTMSAALEPNKSYFVSAIREVDTPYCRQQLWTLEDIDDASWREIWAPPSLTNLVLERDDSGELYLSQKKKERVLRSIFIYYLGYAGPVTAPTAYNFHFFEKLSK